MLSALPKQFDVLCCHPMFGPQSGRGAWDGLPLVFERVRIGDGARCDGERWNPPEKGALLAGRSLPAIFS